MLPYFNELFREYQHRIDDENEKIKQLSKEQSLIKTSPNAYLLIVSNQVPDDVINTILNDPYLKSNAVNHIFNYGNLSRAANDYRILSIKLYKKIDSLLETQPTFYPDILSPIPKKESLNEFLGDYTQIESTNPTTLSISEKTDHLEINHSTYGKMIVFWNSDNYYFIKKSYPYQIFKQYINEKEQHVWEVTNGYIKEVYIKTSDLNL